MTDTSGQVEMNMSYATTDHLAGKILETLQEENCSVGYGMLASALTLGRLINHGRVLEDEEEVKWLEDCMDWANLYFTKTAGGKKDS